MGITFQQEPHTFLKELHFDSSYVAIWKILHFNGDYIPMGITFPHELHTLPKELHFDRNHFSMGTQNCIIIKWLLTTTTLSDPHLISDTI
jgi:hypothetical protein